MSDSPMRLMFKYRHVLLQSTRNDIVVRYAGSIIGIGWALLVPLLLLAIYAVTYLFIFRVQPPDMSTNAYVTYIFSGLVPFIVMSEAISNGMTTVSSSKSTLNNTVFPIDLTPVKPVLISQITLAVGMVITIIGGAIAGTLSWAILYLPVLWILTLMALIGLNWIFSLLNVVFRDLQNIISPLLMILLIASPIAYTPSMVPEKMMIMINLNPAAYFIRAYQSIIVLGKLPPFLSSFAVVFIAFTLFFLGNWFFKRAKKVVVDYV
jgi:lipopolysaccharide transport system permease protein